MRIPLGTRSLAGLAAGLVLGASALAQQWFSVVTPGSSGTGAIVEVDLDTLRLQESGGEVVIRLTHDVLHSHPAGFGFRSFVATAHFDCHQRTITLASAAYYALPAGQGQRVGADSAGRQSGMPAVIIQSVPPATRQALLKATCAPTRSN